MIARKQIFMAQELMRYVNIIDDLFDSIVFLTMFKKNSGTDLIISTPPVKPDDGPVETPATVADVKVLIKNKLATIKTYGDKVSLFLTKVDTLIMAEALQRIGWSRTALDEDIDKLMDEYAFAKNNVDAIQTKDQLTQLGDRLTKNLGFLVLPRKLWSM